MEKLAPALETKIFEIFDERIPFNKFLGLRTRQLYKNHATIEVARQDAFVGDLGKNILHGGVLCSLIDATGGAAAFAALDFDKEQGVNTIDLRVDFLRPATGKHFVATGDVLRKGSRIVFTEMKVTNDNNDLVAHGTGTYSIFLRTAP